LLGGEVDAVTFASSSTVRNLHAVLGDEGFAAALRRTVVACIGPVTAATAREMGLSPQVVAGTHTIDGLVEALERYFEPAPGEGR
jgi:uroporphyrinogen III methyltransferase/synthase